MERSSRVGGKGGRLRDMEMLIVMLEIRDMRALCLYTMPGGADLEMRSGKQQYEW